MSIDASLLNQPASALNSEAPATTPSAPAVPARVETPARRFTWLARLSTHGWLVAVVVVALLLQTVSPDTLALNFTFVRPPAIALAKNTNPGGRMQAPIVVKPAPVPKDRLTRDALLQTYVPERPRRDVITYVVQSGDTLFGIAYTFGLKPETILWSNDSLADNPHMIEIGLELNILPVDGIYHKVTVTDTLQSLAEEYKVSPSAIQNASWNQSYIDKNGQLQPDSHLVIPNGQKKFVVWVIPPPNTGGQPGTGNGTANVGSCGAVPSMPGSGWFTWPTDAHWVSGNPYAPWHQGVDLRATQGANIYAADSGTVIYSGWSTVGYGNLIVIDHANGWQTWYAHLSSLYYACGEIVYQGSVIGLAGSTGRSTGPHLHFETRWQGSLPNPLDVLPPP